MNYEFIARTLNLKHPVPTPFDLIEIARMGIPKKSINSLAECLHIPISELIQYLHVSERTLQRYSPDKLLSSAISDHLLQIAKVYSRSLEVFEDAEDASMWLKQVNISLGNVPPMDLVDTISGIEMVLDELTRIEYGVFA
ncbi:MAG: DUF2384 domain-containing protein [SAR324 cluster bacterium]|nr:DUF2384 domain-containing protein [SAR324 cluster bacterium]